MGESNKGSGSTWVWRKTLIIETAERPPNKRSAKLPKRAGLSRWNRRDPLTITVRYRGGPEAWYELKARGHTLRVPGHEALHDVLERIYEGL